jgi:hypothetical protein
VLGARRDGRRPVDGMSRTDGFFPAAQGSRDAMLTWLYAEDAWATVRGTTTTTSDLDRMLELGRALRPSERTRSGSR